MNNKNVLLDNLEKIHTTPMGVDRIRRNLALGSEVADVVEWCRERIYDERLEITHKGKNWYCKIDDAIITINAYSYTIITAHKTRS